MPEERPWVYRDPYPPEEKAKLDAALLELEPGWVSNTWFLYYDTHAVYTHPYQAKRLTWEYGCLHGHTVDELIEELQAEYGPRGTLVALRARKKEAASGTAT